MAKQAAKKKDFVPVDLADLTSPSGIWEVKRPDGTGTRIMAPTVEQVKAQLEYMGTPYAKGTTITPYIEPPVKSAPVPLPSWHELDRDYHYHSLARSILAGNGRRIAARNGPDGRLIFSVPEQHVRALLELWGSDPISGNGDKVRGYLDEHRSEGFNRLVARIAKGLRRIAGDWSGDRWPVIDWQELALVLDAWVAVPTATGTAKPAKPRPEVPTIADKFAAVPRSLDKWMSLLRAKGIVDVNGSFAMAANTKGKGKLIAAWTAAAELFNLPGYSTDPELVQALVAHLPGLSGLDRVDKVRRGKTFSALVTEYKEDLEVD